MRHLYASPAKHWLPQLSQYATVTCLFCLLGVAITAAVVPMFSSEDVTWTVAHLE